MTTLFIADLHLHDERPDLTRAFLRFLDEKAVNSDALYILGDLFEVWVGDDENSNTASTVRRALRRLNESGVAIYFQCGNRDFLIGEQFSLETGVEVLPDMLNIDLYGTQVQIMHGDQLCTKDTEYQKFKSLVRSKQWQQEFLSKPLSERKEIARKIRNESNSSQQNKTMEIMDVTPEEVDRVLEENAVNFIIHGHTHRPKIHHLPQNRTRIVLGDWDSDLWYLEWCENHQYRLIQQPISENGKEGPELAENSNTS